MSEIDRQRMIGRRRFAVVEVGEAAQHLLDVGRRCIAVEGDREVGTADAAGDRPDHSQPDANRTADHRDAVCKSDVIFGQQAGDSQRLASEVAGCAHRGQRCQGLCGTVLCEADGAVSSRCTRIKIETSDRRHESPP